MTTNFSSLNSTSSDSASSRFLRFAIIVACFCLGIVLRLGNFGFFTTDLTGHFNFIDTDCYYQLRRLVYFLAHFPKTLTFDPLADWPTGSTVDWPDGFIYIIGLPLKIFGVSNFHDLEIGACVVMIVLGMLTCWCIYLLAKRLLKDSSLALLVFFLACTNFLLIRFSCLGEVDHHILEAMFPSAVLLLSFKAFDDQKLWAAIALGLSLTFFLWVSSSSVFMIGVFFLLYAFIFSKPGDLRLYAMVGFSFILSMIPLVIYHRYSLGSWKLLTHPSVFHLMLVSSLAVLAFLVSRYRKLSIKILVGFFILGSVCYFLNVPSILMEPLSWAIQYVFGRVGPLQSVGEASPIFMNFEDLNLDFMHMNFGFFVYLLPLVWVLAFFHKRMSKEDRILILSLAMLAIPGVFQKRFSQIMIGLFIIYLVWGLKKILNYARRLEFRIGPLFALMLLCFSVFPGFGHGFYPVGSPRDRVDQGIAHFVSEKLELKPELVWDRLALNVGVDEGIYLNPNIGHLIQYLTGLGTVTNSFYHWNGFELDFSIRQAKSDDEFRSILKKNRIRYLIVVDDFQFLEFQYRLRGLSSSEFAEKKMANGALATFYHMPVLLNYAWVRWLFAEGDIDQFKRLFRAGFLEEYYYKNVVAYRFDGF